MSNERSPREVCSITIGISGLIRAPLNISRVDWSSQRLLATGGPQFRLGLGSFLVRSPDRFARLFLLERDALDVGGDPVERGGEAQALTLRLVGSAGTELLDGSIGVFEAFADGRVDLLVADLDPELVGDRLEHQLARDRALRLGAEPRDELVGRVAGHLQVDLQRAAAAAEHLVEALEQGARPRLDDRAVDAHVRGIDELVQCGAAERLLDVRRDLGAEAALDLDAELVERVELGCGHREVVVQRRQHLLLDLLHRRLDDPQLVVWQLEAKLAGLAHRHADQLLLELRNETARAELDDVVLLPLAALADHVEDDGVAQLRGPILHRRQLRDGGAEDVELRSDELLRDLDLWSADLELRPVRHVRLRQDGNRRGEPPVLFVARG